jgi:hypothetical protein
MIEDTDPNVYYNARGVFMSLKGIKVSKISAYYENRWPFVNKMTGKVKAFTKKNAYAQYINIHEPHTCWTASMFCTELHENRTRSKEKFVGFLSKVWLFAKITLAGQPSVKKNSSCEFYDPTNGLISYITVWLPTHVINFELLNYYYYLLQLGFHPVAVVLH